MCGMRSALSKAKKLMNSIGDVSKVGYFFDIPASLKLSLYTVMT